jgi:diguanylate cyclase (GGDEF)-like protein
VFIADCDSFKAVNDTHGHQVGDLVLIELAALMSKSVRAIDTVGRWGGEEFLAILPETGIDGATQLADKLRREIEAYAFPVVGCRTASFGVAVLRPTENIKDLIARADAALYLAKESGRNRVEGNA